MNLDTQRLTATALDDPSSLNELAPARLRIIDSLINQTTNRFDGNSINELISLLETSPNKSIQEECTLLAKKVAQLQSLQGELPNHIKKADVINELKDLLKKNQHKTEICFSDMIHRIRNETSLCANLEYLGIPEAIQNRDVFNHSYPARVIARHGIQDPIWSEIKKDDVEFSSNGRYQPMLGVVFLDIEGSKEITKNTVVSCWANLANNGCLPDFVGTLAHELHHRIQNVQHPQWRFLDVIPALRLPPVEWLHVDHAAAEASAWLLGMLSPSEYEKYGSSLNSVHKMLWHPEFSSYRLDDLLPFETSRCLMNLLLLGVSGDEMAAIIGGTRFKDTMGAQRYLMAKESELRTSQGLEDDTLYIETLALRFATTIISNEIEREKAMRIARNGLVELRTALGSSATHSKDASE